MSQAGLISSFSCIRCSRDLINSNVSQTSLYRSLIVAFFDSKTLNAFDSFKARSVVYLLINNKVVHLSLSLSPFSSPFLYFSPFPLPVFHSSSSPLSPLSFLFLLFARLYFFRFSIRYSVRSSKSYGIHRIITKLMALHPTTRSYDETVSLLRKKDTVQTRAQGEREREQERKREGEGEKERVGVYQRVILNGRRRNRRSTIRKHRIVLKTERDEAWSKYGQVTKV